jgi:bifunctional DNA-binding transcriptional regulator/antitoxin component of YhaV-PrlF toxin-antitoxin module
MSGSESPVIPFSKKVNENGQLVIPQDQREELTIDGRDALVELKAKPVSGADTPMILLSKKVDDKGRLVIPKEHREALSIDGREALVEFEAKKVTYLDDEDGGDGSA